MKKHIGLVLGFCLSLTLLSVSSVSNAAPQIVGTKCVKAGAFRTAKTVRYQCKKSAKGLRWVTISAKSLPTTTTSSTTTTTTTIPLPIDEIARKVQQLVIEAMQSEVTTSVKLEYLSEYPSNPLDEISKREGLVKALKLFAQLGFDHSTSVIVMFGQSNDGVRKALLAQGCQGIALSDPNAGVLGAALDGNCGANRVAVTVNAPSTPTRERSSIDFQHELPHEVFHTWQSASTSSCVSWRCGNSDFPRWLWEGTPQVMTRLAYWSWNKSKTHQQWHDYWYTSQRPDMRSMCIGVPIEEMIVPWTPWPGPGWCAYSKGQLAVEVLIANYGGFDTMKKLHTTKTRAGYTNFPEHFRSVTGRDISEFYAEVNSYFAKRGWN